MFELEPVLPSLEAWLSQPRKMLIGGDWVEAASGKTFPTYNPATGEVLAEIAEADAEDVNRAVRAARNAFADGSPWRRMTPAQRGKLIWRIADLMDANREELAQLETLNNGRSIRVSRSDVPFSAEWFRYYGGWPTKLQGDTIPVSIPNRLNYTLREPVGVVGLIIPWNFPLMMATWKLAPALAAGCTVILKPAEQTPLSALRLGELFLEAGFPPGVVNICPGYGDTAGAALTAHPDVDKVAFTGSTEVGRKIVQASAGNLKRVSLELGGKSPDIVFADADLDAASRGAMFAIFSNMGQSCIAGSRLFVESSIRDEFVERMAERARGLRVGPGLSPKVHLGPLISQEQLDRVQGYISSGVQEGASLHTGGERIAELGDGYFLQPTIFTDVHDSMRIVQEEIFGPVVAVTPFDDMDELIPRANGTQYGLAAGIWTRDIGKAHRVAAALKAGTVWVNCYDQFDAAAPFGGYKQSGWGREMGRAALDLYTETKSVWVALD
ncbi:MAG: aldehyde dehydrogenase family protein [Anaerolineae bacterium]